MRAVRRNLKRFPDDFMFEMTHEELENWRNQFGTSNREKMGIRIRPFVFYRAWCCDAFKYFNSDQAIAVKISIMRIFAKLRSFLLLEKGLTEMMNSLEPRTHKIFKIVFERLDALETIADSKLPKTKKKIGLK